MMIFLSQNGDISLIFFHVDDFFIPGPCKMLEPQINHFSLSLRHVLLS